MRFFKAGCFVLMLTVAASAVSTSQADITVDPDNVGETDVVLLADGVETVLTNPVPDPFDLGEMVISVGHTGDGALLVDNGGQIIGDKGFVIGYEDNSSGIAQIDGVGSSWTMRRTDASMFVGVDGYGDLRITNGGIVTGVQNAMFGRNTGSQGHVTIQGANSELSILNYVDLDPPPNITFYFTIYMGYQSDAVFDILDGGSLLTTSTILAMNPGSSATVDIVGSGSTWTVDGRLDVGVDGEAVIRISEGGRLVTEAASVGSSYFGDVPNGTGIIVVDGVGSVWDQTGGLYSISVGELYDAKLLIRDGGLVRLNHATRFEAYGTLEFGIGANGSGLLDVAAGFFAYGGSTLRVTLDDGIVPAAGEQFTVVTASAIGTPGGFLRTFTHEDLQRIAGDYLLDWAVRYNPNDITLEVLSSVLAGDFDEDNDVDGDDFLRWQSSFGLPIGIPFDHTDGDADLDGDVDGDDFLIWQRQFGMTDGGGALASVPEPTALGLAMAVVFFGAAGFRRRNRLASGAA